MKNTEAFQRIKGIHDIEIERLFWVAGSTNNVELEEMLDDIAEEDFVRIFKEIPAEKAKEIYNSDTLFTEILRKYEKFGFLAEIHTPCFEDFIFKGEKPYSWSTPRGVRIAHVVYGETREQLLDEMGRAARQNFETHAERAKSKHKNHECS